MIFAFDFHGCDCHVCYCEIYSLIASLILDDVCKEEVVLEPLTHVIILLRLECTIDLIEELPCPWLRLRVFMNRKRNTNFQLEGVDYELSPYLSNVQENEAMPYIVSPVLLLKHTSANSVFYYIILLICLLIGEK